LLIGEWRVFRLTVTPVVESLRFIVPFAWIPLTILWFGTSFTGKIVLVAYAVFFVMVVSTARAIAHVEPTLTRVGTMLGMGPWRLALRVHLRAAAPTLSSAARAAAAIGWIAVVAAEYIGASAGLLVAPVVGINPEVGQLILRGDYSHQSRIFFSAFEVTELSQEGYGWAKARLAYVAPGAGWQLAAFIDNITDEEVISNATYIADLVDSTITGNMAPPRTYGVQFKVQF